MRTAIGPEALSAAESPPAPPLASRGVVAALVLGGTTLGLVLSTRFWFCRPRAPLPITISLWPGSMARQAAPGHDGLHAGAAPLVRLCVQQPGAEGKERREAPDADGRRRRGLAMGPRLPLSMWGPQSQP